VKKCPYCGQEYPDDADVCAIDQTPLIASVSRSDNLAGPGLPAKPTVACPACGGLDGYKPALELRSFFSLTAFLAGGLLAVIFLNAGRRKRVRCNKCGALFSIRTPLSRVSLAVFWLLVAPTIIVLSVLLFRLLHLFFAPGG